MLAFPTATVAGAENSADNMAGSCPWGTTVDVWKGGVAAVATPSEVGFHPVGGAANTGDPVAVIQPAAAAAAMAERSPPAGPRRFGCGVAAPVAQGPLLAFPTVAVAGAVGGAA
jgi:hypothetical protein